VWVARLNGGACKMVGNAKQVEAAETNVRKIEQIKLTP
jgi:hypothetical protein